MVGDDVALDRQLNQLASYEEPLEEIDDGTHAVAKPVALPCGWGMSFVAWDHVTTLCLGIYQI